MTKKDVQEHLFTDLGISENLLKSLHEKGFKHPTPIQHQVISDAISGNDIIGIAQTGTGKTFAFGIPMIQRIGLDKTQGLILLPTRELASQVDVELQKIGRQLGLRTAVIIGGVSQYKQEKVLKKKPHLIVATPGRLFDLMEQNIISLDKVGVVTLDEADRMLDMGFLPQIRQILQSLPKKRQTMLFSATMPDSISKLASEFMQMPLRVEIAPQGTSAENVEQEIIVVSKDKKNEMLLSLLKDYKDETVILFSRTKHGASRIARNIRNAGYTATEIHSNRSQAQRRIALEGFRKGKYKVLVATDIAARGIDVKDISLVINFDLPDNSEDYVHRIGRTGRAGRSGKAISFVTPSQKADVKKIERLIKKTLPILSLPDAADEYAERLYKKNEARSTPKRSYGGRRRGGPSKRGSARRGYGSRKPRRRGR